MNNDFATVGLHGLVVGTIAALASLGVHLSTESFTMAALAWIAIMALGYWHARAIGLL